MPLNVRIQWNAGTACVSECVLKTLACRVWQTCVSALLRPALLGLPLRSPPPSTESKTPKTRKVSKKSPERSSGPPDPGPRKSLKKVRKVKKKSENQLFSRLFGLLLDFFGVRDRGVPNSSRETFLRIFRFSGSWTL